MNITEKIKRLGKDNVIVQMASRPLHIVPLLSLGFTSSNDEPIETFFRVVEKRYKLNENYKIELEPLEEGFGKETFYQADFKILYNQGHVKVFFNASAI